LNNVNKFIDELSLHKERLDVFKANKLKNMKYVPGKTESYSALANQHMKIVGFVGNILLNSFTCFFVPIIRDLEVYNESYVVFEKCFKYYFTEIFSFHRLSTLRYSVEKENIDTTRKINIMSYQLFLKAYETLPLAVNDSAEKKSFNFSGTQYEDSADNGHPPFLSQQISPIVSKPPKKEIYIQDNSLKDTPDKFHSPTGESVQMSKLRNQANDSFRKIEQLQERVEQHRKLGSGIRFFLLPDLKMLIVRIFCQFHQKQEGAPI
jgi:hypothetical protein